MPVKDVFFPEMGIVETGHCPVSTISNIKNYYL
jgi:hypothetical protein